MTSSNTPTIASAPDKDAADWQAIQAAERVFAQDVPDYRERVFFVAQVRAAQLAALNPFATGDQIGQQLKVEGLAVGREAFQRGQNPGEVFVALSNELGYRAEPVATFYSIEVH